MPFKIHHYIYIYIYDRWALFINFFNFLSFSLTKNAYYLEEYIVQMTLESAFLWRFSSQITFIIAIEQ